MSFIQNLSIEIKTCAVFGIFALIFSLLTGIVYDVGMGAVIIRLLIIIPVFIAIGYGMIFVFKKYIPELYELFDKSGDSFDESGVKDNLNPDETDFNLDDEQPANSTGNEDDTQQNISGENSNSEGFTEITGSEFPNMVSNNDLEQDSTLNAPEGKLGKHILKNETIAKYEPKIMAEAIRTMMLRDED